MDKNVYEAICEARKLIKEKTGIKIPMEIFSCVEKLDRKTHLGDYFASMIRLRPHTLWTESLTFEQASNLKGAPVTSKEELKKIQENLLESNKEQRIKTVVHECGHFIHDNYFKYKKMYIPIKGSGCRDYARKNYRENFAVAFENYIMEDIDKDSPRYKKMEQIMNIRRRTRKIFYLDCHKDYEGEIKILIFEDNSIRLSIRCKHKDWKYSRSALIVESEGYTRKEIAKFIREWLSRIRNRENF